MYFKQRECSPLVSRTLEFPTVDSVATTRMHNTTKLTQITTFHLAGCHKMSESTTTPVDLREWCENKEYSKIADHFTDLAGSPEEARQLLVQVVNSFDVAGGVGNPRKRAAPSSSTSTVSSMPSTSVDGSFFVQDLLDDAVVTSLIHIPNDPAVIGAIIGPHGRNIKVSLLNFCSP